MLQIFQVSFLIDVAYLLYSKQIISSSVLWRFAAVKVSDITQVGWHLTAIKMYQDPNNMTAHFDC